MNVGILIGKCLEMYYLSLDEIYNILLICTIIHTNNIPTFTEKLDRYDRWAIGKYIQSKQNFRLICLGLDNIFFFFTISFGALTN